MADKAKCTNFKIQKLSKIKIFQRVEFAEIFMIFFLFFEKFFVGIFEFCQLANHRVINASDKNNCTKRFFFSNLQNLQTVETDNCDNVNTQKLFFEKSLVTLSI